MFSRRRGSSNPPVDRATMQAAAAAAGQAYLQSSTSHASLSSAAAAAALRSRTSSPEPVSGLVTKRMARRGSVSSVGSGSVMGSGTRGGVGRGGLLRQNSGGSMTDRTFRSPSPGGRFNGAMSPAPDAPPVPALPKNIPTSHKRSASMEPPQRMMSPTPTGRGGRGASVDRLSMPPPATSRHNKRLSNVVETPEQNSKVNYSRPMSSLTSSPATPTSAGTKQYTNGTGSWFSQPSGSGSAANARPKTSDGLPAQRAKKKSAAAAEGSHLAQANKDSAAASYAEGDMITVFDPSSRTFITKPRDQPSEPEPPSPTVPDIAAPAPGSYDPHTRRIVPGGPPNDAPMRVTKQRPPPVVTKLEPPPKNPARYSPSSSPSSPRAAGTLHHQPSVVREDPEAEEAATTGSPITSVLKNTDRTIQTSAGPAKMYVAPGSASHQRSSSLDVPRQPNEVRGRNVSSSPARSAHFSPSPVIEAVKHEPPTRSYSPVKSAMKHSPSSSVRAASPMNTFSPTRAKVPPSDASDTASIASLDNIMGPRKKKSVRVSFDEHPTEVEAAGASAQPKTITRSPIEEDEMEDFSRPRPALPSFGSVRRSSGRAPEMAEKVTEMPPERQESSNDQVVGAILANHHAAKDTVAEPLAPEVTSKEGAGYVSDESDDEIKPETTATPAMTATEETSKETTDTGAPKTRDFATEAASKVAPHTQDNGDVPAINLLPPTPGEEAGKELGEDEQAETGPKPKSSFEGFRVPGSWANSYDKDVAAEPERSAVSAPITSIRSEPQELQRPPPNLGAIDEDSDDSAAFSDAAEDLSDLDEGGFASLDAIAVSPLGPSPVDKGKAPAMTASPPDSPSTALAEKKIHQAQASGDWGEATAYWSKLTRQQREQMERQHFSSDDEARPAVAAVKKPKKKRSGPPQFAAAGTGDGPGQAPPQQRNAPPVGSQTAMPKTLRARQGPAPAAASAGGDGELHMRTSMRARQGPAPAAAPAGGDGEVHMRTSMRDGRAGGGRMATSMRSGPPPQQRPQSEYLEQRGQDRNIPPRPKSSGGPQPRPRTGSDAMPTSQQSSFPRMQQNQAPPLPRQQGAPAAPAGAFTNKLQRQVTNDSDSESSFKKKRRSAASADAGRYSMKRSMRAGSIGQESIEQRPTSPTPAPRRGGGGFSIRSLSPTGSMFSNRGRGDKLRESLRSGSVDAGAKRTTLRSGQAPRGGFGSSGRSSAAVAAPSKPRFKSRFGDSDDEDEKPSRSLFKSRYADSDDDEPGSPRVIAGDLAPVRGIPRKQGQYDGDSTDLEDEDDDPRKASRGRGKQSNAMVTNPADVEKAMEAARRNLGLPATDGTAHEAKEGTALGQGSLRKPAVQEQPEPKSRLEDVQPLNEAPKKRGFMGSILRRNRNSTQSVQQVAPSSPSQALPPLPSSPQAGQAPDTAIPSSPSTAKLVRRGSQQPRLKRGDSTFSNATAPPGSSAGGKEGDSWPLPPVPKITANGVAGGSEDRPSTSDGVNPEAIKLARTMRPDLAPRSKSGQPLGNRVRIAAGSKEEDGGSMTNEQRAIYSARTGKKKRFPMLRKAFGLHD